MNHETSHSMFNLRREYFGFRNNFLACFGPGASSIMEIFLISLTARFVWSDPVTAVVRNIPFLIFTSCHFNKWLPLLERSECMNYYSGWARVGWVEIVNQSEYYTVRYHLVFSPLHLLGE